MKKIFFTIETILIMSVLASIVCLLKLQIAWVETLISILILVVSLFNLLYVLSFKDRKVRLSSTLIVASICLTFLANIFMVKNTNLLFILLCLSQAILIAALILKSKFCVFDIFYIIALAIPMLMFVNLSPMFGYANIWNRDLISLFILLNSAAFGLSVGHLIKRQSAFNITFSIFAFLNLIYGLGLIIVKQSNVTHKVAPILTIAFYVVMLLLSLTLLVISKDLEKSNVAIKRNIIYSTSILMVVILICYTIVSNFIAFNFVSAKVFKDDFLNRVGENLNIPIVEIRTQENELPKNKNDYINCSFEISNCENEEFNFSVPMAKNYDDDGCVGIRLRGNSTMRARKQPYRIKFDEKQSFFGLKANKSWVLLADYYDQSYIRNYTAFKLADKFDNLDFVPTPHHVALIINNEFKGLYLLCEQMDEKKGRANVDEDFDLTTDKEFPFFVEMDVGAVSEGITGIDNFYVESVENYVEIKFPEADERDATKTHDPVYDYIYEYINAVGEIVKTGEKVKVSFRENEVGLEDLVDVDSAVDYYLVNEIMMNIDSAFKSIYFHKTKDGKMMFGPVWDFDFSFTTELVAPYEKSYIEGVDDLFIAENSVIFKHLIKNEEFYNRVAARYNSMNNAILETCETLKDYKNKIDSVAIIDSKMWHGITGEFQYDMQYDYARIFLMDRFEFLNSAFSKPHAEFLSLI